MFLHTPGSERVVFLAATHAGAVDDLWSAYRKQGASRDDHRRTTGEVSVLSRLLIEVSTTPLVGTLRVVVVALNGPFHQGDWVARFQALPSYARLVLVLNKPPSAPAKRLSGVACVVTPPTAAEMATWAREVAAQEGCRLLVETSEILVHRYPHPERLRGEIYKLTRDPMQVVLPPSLLTQSDPESPEALVRLLARRQRAAAQYHLARVVARGDAASCLAETSRLVRRLVMLTWARVPEGDAPRVLRRSPKEALPLWYLARETPPALARAWLTHLAHPGDPVERLLTLSQCTV